MDKARLMAVAGVLGSLIAWAVEGHAQQARLAEPAGVAAASSLPASPPPVVDTQTFAKLRDVAYGKDSQGEFKEPSRRVREAAAEALSHYAAAPTPQVQPAAWPTAAWSPGAPLGTPIGRFQFASFQPPPVQPMVPPVNVQPVLPPPPPGPAAGGGGEAQGGLAFAPSLEESFRETLAAPSGTPAQGMGSGETQRSGATDTAQALSQSSGVQDVEVQRRSPIAFDPRIRGYRWGEIYTQADGVYWTPARMDLDTMLSKIDPGMIQSVAVVPGPYGLRYGPGFAFLDVTRAPTPRFSNGFNADFDSTFGVHSNGGQIYGRETVSGGDSDWGFRVSFGDRKGSDYTAGNGQKIPSSYDAQDLWGEVSFDINPHQKLEIAYQHIDQMNTEYPGQFFDLNYLGTYAFQTRFIDDDPAAPWAKLVLESWYNRTVFNGDTLRKHNPSFPTIERIEASLDIDAGEPLGTQKLNAITNGNAYSSGARTKVTFGDKDWTQLNVGTDVRYLGQVVGEQFQIIDTSDPANDSAFNTNMPHAWLVDPGAYAELSHPVSDCWTIALGGRVDFVQTMARAGDLLPSTNLSGIDLTQDNVLYAFYLTNKFTLGEHWTLTGGVGQAQTPPTLIERYADGLFISTLQTGYSRMVGNPELMPERDWQADLGLAAEYENWRMRINGFNALVYNYITFQDAGSVGGFGDARLLYFANTPQATLVGGDMAYEYDWSAMLTPFFKASYVDGRDRTIGQPLPGMTPLDTTLGLRIHDTQKGRHWGLEVATRIVATQDRLGTILNYQGGGTTTEVEERTPAFAVCNLRGYYNLNKKFSLTAGIDNVFNTNYQEHLDWRISGPVGFTPPHGETRVLEPGISPYFGVNWVF